MTYAPLHLSRSLRHIEKVVSARPSPPPLMERAGLACANAARSMLGDSGRILVIAGPGNNGGDALVAARHLRNWWHDVTVVFMAEESRLPGDALNALKAWRASGGSLSNSIPPGRRWDLCLDGLLGIGLQRDLDSAFQQLVLEVNDLRIPVLAIDIPSGICADTGRVRGCAVRAARTLTFLGLKPGLYTLDGPDYCGDIVLDTLGIEDITPPIQDGWLLDAATAANCLKPRARNSHKGSYGSVGIIGGSSGMTGALALAARAALRLGAGRVYAGFCIDAPPPCDWQQPELMLRRAEDLFQIRGLTCLAIGPGMGTSEQAHSLMERALSSRMPLVIDADALNLVAGSPALSTQLTQRQNGSILTPHPAEAARLLACRIPDIQNDRVSAAIAMARKFSSHVVLKGNGSVCVAPDGGWFINPTGNPALCSAGTGDVLTGIIAALLAQGLRCDEAMKLGVCLHGAAADDLVSARGGPVGVTASEITDAAREKLNQLVYRRA